MHRVRHRRLVGEHQLDPLALAIGSGGTSLFQTTPLSDQTYPAISPVRSIRCTRSALRGASGSSLRAAALHSSVSAAEGSAAGSVAPDRWHPPLPAHAGPAALALQYCQHRMRAGAGRHRQADVAAAARPRWENAGRDRLHPEAVHRDQLAAERARDRRERRSSRRTVDHPQQHRPARLDANTSGSARVRSLARKASYFTSFRSGSACHPSPCPGRGTRRHRHATHRFHAAARLHWRRRRHGHGWRRRCHGHAFTLAQSCKICSGGVKLKSASITTTSCCPRWSRSRG